MNNKMVIEMTENESLLLSLLFTTFVLTVATIIGLQRAETNAIKMESRLIESVAHDSLHDSARALKDGLEALKQAQKVIQACREGQSRIVPRPQEIQTNRI